MGQAFILSACRSPLGRFCGAFSDLPAPELAAAASRGALERAGVSPAEIDEALFGCARQAGAGPNIARQVSIRAGLPHAVPAFTVNKACASSLKAIALGAQAIAAGDADLVLVGGVESMSRVPFLLDRARAGYRLGSAEAVDAMYRDGFLCPLCGEVMGQTAERLAERFAISRAEQDDYAAASQQKCERARKEGRFKDEIVPVPAADRIVEADETPREGVTAASLGGLPAVFKAGGTVHAGNSSGIADGAAALVLASEERARQLGGRPLGRIAGWVSVGLDPAEMGLGPVPALRALEKKIGWRIGDVDLLELNEAFAAQVLACDRELGLDRARLNVNGGAIALGHPVGATGARIVTTLLHEMKRRAVRRGIATLCVSGGLGMAVALERGWGDTG